MGLAIRASYKYVHMVKKMSFLNVAELCHRKADLYKKIYCLHFKNWFSDTALAICGIQKTQETKSGLYCSGPRNKCGVTLTVSLGLKSQPLKHDRYAWLKYFQAWRDVDWMEWQELTIIDAETAFGRGCIGILPLFRNAPVVL